METVAGILSKSRENKQLLLREVGAALGLDPSIVSKYEKGERLPTQKQIEQFADFYKIDKDHLLTVYLSDKILQEMGDSPQAAEAIKLALKKLKD
ncbi:MAG: hypothetical protein BGO55_03385 [Sphingobacteriales bacterium 50-39]|nr:helix-turn-helix transcriptional regulator [Sphingobacteriales bacterium]OJW55597.1 MAG: hypothetical protein BGO55_03385 [Sphingobacteriales bacterium 50-39]